MDPNQPAFPELHIHHFQNEDAEGKHDNVVPRWMGGLTKREYVATQMMVAAIVWDGLMNDKRTGSRIATIATHAVQAADVLIAELNK